MAHHGDDPLAFKRSRRLAELFDAAREQRLGATGRYPQGRLNADDEGEIRFGIATDSVNGKVIIDFGKPVAWVGCDREQALALAALLKEKAEELKRR